MPPQRPLQSTRSSSAPSRGKFHRTCWQKNGRCIGKRSQLQRSKYYHEYEFPDRIRRTQITPPSHTLASHYFPSWFLGYPLTYLRFSGGYVPYSYPITGHPPSLSHTQTLFRKIFSV